MADKDGNRYIARPFSGGRVSTGRAEAFSDGVIAVVITLLIFNIKPPQGLRSDAELWHGVIAISRALLAWVVSFAFVLTFWVHHHYFFASLKCSDRGLLWLNGLFLLTLAVLPFPLGLMSEYPSFTAPLILLCAAMLLACLSFSAMRLYATFSARLLRDTVAAGMARRAVSVSLIAPALCSISLAMAFVLPPVAMATQGLLLVVFFIYLPNLHALEPPTTDADQTLL